MGRKVRQATEADIDRVSVMAMRFISDAGKPEGDPKDIREVVANLIKAGGCFVSDGGMILGVIAPLYYRPDYLEAHELAWWAEDGMGRHLLAVFEEWALANGAQVISLSTLPDFTRKAAGKLLERRGFEMTEVSYRKVF